MSEANTIPKKNIKIGYFNYSLCEKCGGACCKSHAGQYIPSDFKQSITVDFILSLLKTGKFAIDWWDGDVKDNGLSQVYYIRARHKDEPAIDGSWGGICVNWTKEKGCSLNEDKRPFQCRMLIPKFDINNGYACKTSKKHKADKRGCTEAWYDYQNILNEVAEVFKD